MALLCKTTCLSVFSGLCAFGEGTSCFLKVMRLCKYGGRTKFGQSFHAVGKGEREVTDLQWQTEKLVYTNRRFKLDKEIEEKGATQINQDCCTNEPMHVSLFTVTLSLAAFEKRNRERVRWQLSDSCRSTSHGYSGSSAFFERKAFFGFSRLDHAGFSTTLQNSLEMFFFSLRDSEAHRQQTAFGSNTAHHF